MSENKVGRPSYSEPQHVFYFNKPTYEVWTRLKLKVSQSSGEKSLSNNEFALWLLQSYETRFTDSSTRCAKINSENINDHADGIKENSKDGDVHSRSVASFCSGSTARPQNTDVAQASLRDTGRIFHILSATKPAEDSISLSAKHCIHLMQKTSQYPHLTNCFPFHDILTD